jgi:FkbM family methyltransferase
MNSAPASFSALTPLEKWLRAVARVRFLPGSKSAYRKFCRRVRGRNFEVTTPEGVKFHLTANDSVASQILVFGQFEPGIGKLLKKLLPPGGVFVDLGCNLGYFTCLVGAHVPDALVVAVDANPAMTQACAQNAALNGLKPHIHSIGIGARREKLCLTFPGNAPSHATFGKAGNASRSRDLHSVEAIIIPLSELLDSEGLAQVDLLKIDVEGYEDAIFSAIDEDLAARFSSVVFEFCE